MLLPCHQGEFCFFFLSDLCRKVALIKSSSIFCGFTLEPAAMARALPPRTRIAASSPTSSSKGLFINCLEQQQLAFQWNRITIPIKGFDPKITLVCLDEETSPSTFTEINVVYEEPPTLSLSTNRAREKESYRFSTISIAWYTALLRGNRLRTD